MTERAGGMTRPLLEHIFAPPPVLAEPEDTYWKRRRAWPPAANALHPEPLKREGRTGIEPACPLGQDA